MKSVQIHLKDSFTNIQNLLNKLSQSESKNQVFWDFMGKRKNENHHISIESIEEKDVYFILFNFVMPLLSHREQIDLFHTKAALPTQRYHFPTPLEDEYQFISYWISHSSNQGRKVIWKLLEFQFNHFPQLLIRSLF
jgi:hypothetical protein